MNLNGNQIKNSLILLKEYIKDKEDIKVSISLDKNRIEVINKDLGTLVENFLNEKISLSEFKSKNDGINKRNELWGFKGIKGQMFFNVLFNNTNDLDECEQELRNAISIPKNDIIASSRIKTFISYITRVGDEIRNSGESKHKIPKITSIPYFLSYFWQIQDYKIWPVFYTSTVSVMIDCDIWNPSENLAEDYIAYKQIHEELIKIFSKENKSEFDLYEVEHVFYHKYNEKIKEEQKISKVKNRNVEIKIEHDIGLPDSYIPPIVAIIPDIARNDKKLQKIVQSGTNLQTAFEKHVHSAFSILGYDSRLMGQGKGRVPDGLALDVDDSYAIIWDAKMRSDKYSMGTDDRNIKEYILSQSRDLKKRKHFRNIYFIIISSSFSDDYDENISNIQMETDVNEVILMEAEALVEMVNFKLRDPLNITLGQDGMQRLFTTSGILSVDKVRNNFM